MTSPIEERVNMASLQKIASTLVLPFALMIAGAGCMAEAEDESTGDAAQQEETTGEAKEACGGSWGACPLLGGSWGRGMGCNTCWGGGTWGGTWPGTWGGGMGCNTFPVGGVCNLLGGLSFNHCGS